MMTAFAPRLKTTPDAQLATVAAIQFRVADLKTQIGAAIAGRIKALEARLPAELRSTPAAIVHTPARFNAGLLAGKSERQAGYCDRYVGYDK